MTFEFLYPDFYFDFNVPSLSLRTFKVMLVTSIGIEISVAVLDLIVDSVRPPSWDNLDSKPDFVKIFRKALDWVETQDKEKKKLKGQIGIKEKEKEKAEKEAEIALLIYKQDKLPDFKKLADDIDKLQPAELDDPEEKKVGDTCHTDWLAHSNHPLPNQPSPP